MLLLSLVFGVGGGVWFGMVAPVRQQWEALEPIFSNGGTIETTPSQLSAWVKWTLPNHQSDHVLTVNLNRNFVSDETIDALPDLIRLERLYLERTKLQPRHLSVIAKLNGLRRLSIWGNDALTDQEIAQLAELPNLEVIDFSQCHKATWRCLLPFQNTDIETRHSFHDSNYVLVHPGEVRTLASIPMMLEKTSTVIAEKGINALDLKELWRFPNLSQCWVSMSERSNFDALFDFPTHEPATDLTFTFTSVRIQRKHLTPNENSRSIESIRSFWETFGPAAHTLTLEALSQYPPGTMIVFEIKRNDWEKTLKVRLTCQSTNFGDNLEEQLELLPALPNIVNLRHDQIYGRVMQELKTLNGRVPNATLEEIWRRKE